jgi:glutamine synthetase
MAKIKLEYLWLDGYFPTQNLRSKTKVEEHENFQGTVEELGLSDQTKKRQL